MNRQPKQKKSLYRYWLITLIVLLVVNLLIGPMLQGARTTQESYSSFLDKVEERDVSKAEIDNGTIYYELKGEDGKTYAAQAVNDPDLVNRLREAGVEFSAVKPSTTSPFLYSMLSLFLPWLLLWGLGYWFFRRMQKKMSQASDSMSFTPGDDQDKGGGFGGFGGMFGGMNGLGKSNAKVYKGEQTNTKFSDVAGQEEAKNNLIEIVDFLKNPKKYQEIGAKMPKGALLVGPPGTGKTLLARAVAGEAGVPFFAISGSEFVEMFVGRGAAKVRDLFKQAREKAPCIVFIDEIDTVGKKRDAGGISGNDEREQTLNQLLAEMDGFDGSKGVVLLAATNRPETLDPALTRPGRFDRRIPVELPDLKGREDILKLHAKNVKASPSIDYNEIARAAAGTSGADLANIVNEGALLAVRDGRKQVTQRDMEEAIEIVIAGEQKKGAVISPRERMIVAYHEIGHALVAAKSKNAAPVHKITIIPRTKGALGYTMQVEAEETNLLTKEEAYQRIVTYTGGRAAEELVFHSITSGAANDIEQATKLARAMVTRLGMSENFGMTALESVNNAYLGGDTSLACSDETAAKIDEEVVALIGSAYTDATKILSDNIMKLHELAKYLYEKETITGEEFMEILNRPADDSAAAAQS